MDTALLDAAFRLVSHSLGTEAARVNPPVSHDAMTAELKREFPDAAPSVLEDALARARDLERVAVEMADQARGPKNDLTGPPLNQQTLAARCPGFSSQSYLWTVNDGFILTRK